MARADFTNKEKLVSQCNIEKHFSKDLTHVEQKILNLIAIFFFLYLMKYRLTYIIVI